MSDQESPADLLDEPMPFEFLDPKSQKLWQLPLSGRTIEHELKLQRHIEQRAYQALQRGRAFMALQDYQLGLDAWLQQCATGRYAFGGVACFDALRDKTVYAEDIWLHFQAHNQMVTRELVGRILADDSKAEELAKILGQVDDPFRQRRPAGTAAPAEAAPALASSPST